MIFDPEKPVQTRDGRKARIICTDRVARNEGPVVALVDESGHEESWFYTKSGRLFGMSEEDDLDLINIPEEHEVMVTCQRHRGDGEIGCVVGKPNSAWKAIASKRITFTEGEFEE